MKVSDARDLVEMYRPATGMQDVYRLKLQAAYETGCLVWVDGVEVELIKSSKDND